MVTRSINGIVCFLLVTCFGSLAVAHADAPPRPRAFSARSVGNGSDVILSWSYRAGRSVRFRFERLRVSPGVSLRRANRRMIARGATTFVDSPGQGTFRYRMQALARGESSEFTRWIRVRVVGTTDVTPTPGGGNPDSTPTPTPSPTPTPYVEGIHECNDQVDNNSDGLTDAADAGCFGPNQRESRVSNDGWERFSPSADTRVVYVSVSDGEDCSGCGLLPERPVRTLRRGYELLRDGYPDWLLLKRGDSWMGEALGIDSSWQKSGRSGDEPMVVGGYGVGPRPAIRPADGRGGLYSIHPMSHVAFVGLHLEPRERAWFLAPTGVAFLGAQSDVLFEDLYVRGFGTNFVIQAYAGVPTDITIRRSIIVDAWSATSHSQGIFSSNVEGLLLEENVFDHNGWQDGAVLATLTSARWNAAERTLTQTGAFGAASRPERWQNGGSLRITGGLFTQGTVANPSGTATGTVFRGDLSLSEVDGYYTGKYLKFTSGANASGPTARFQRILRYVGATREFTVATQNDAFLPPADGDTFRIDVMGLFTVQERLSDDAIRLTTTDLSPVDLTTGDITSGAGVAATIFNRSMYLSGGQGNVITRRNIDANGASGGIQQRKGGVSEENLFLRSPLALGFGHAQNSSGTVRGSIVGNVLLGARDIELAPRGFGISVTGNGPYQGGSTVYADGVEVAENIIAHNEFGTSNLIALEIGNWSTNLRVHHNIVYNWRSPSGGGTALRKNAGLDMANIEIRENDFQQPVAGQVIQVHDTVFPTGILNFEMNRYFSARPVSSWFYFNAGNRSASEWATVANDAGTTSQVSYPDPNRTIETYMASRGETPTYDAFMIRARALSKTNWNPDYSAIRVINYVREGFGKAARLE